MAIKSLQCLRVMMLFMVSNLTLAFSSSLSSHPAASSPYQSNDNCQSNNNSELNRSKSNENHAESFNPHLAAPIGPHTVTLKPSVRLLTAFCEVLSVFWQFCHCSAFVPECGFKFASAPGPRAPLVPSRFPLRLWRSGLLFCVLLLLCLYLWPRRPRILVTVRCTLVCCPLNNPLDWFG
jgi:hypothetical protein